MACLSGCNNLAMATFALNSRFTPNHFPAHSCARTGSASSYSIFSGIEGLN